MSAEQRQGGTGETTEKASSFLSKAGTAFSWLIVIAVAGIGGAIGKGLVQPALSDKPEPITFQEFSLEGLSFRAPPPFEEMSSGDSIPNHHQAWLASQAFYEWNDEKRSVQVIFLKLEPGASYDLEVGLRGSMDNILSVVQKEFGGPVLDYNIRDTTISGHVAVAGIATVKTDRGPIFMVRTRAARASRRVWLLSIAGHLDKRTARLGDSVFESMVIR